MTERRALIVRADAGAAVGLGHLMRCTSLARAWSARGGLVHVVGNIEPALAAKPAAFGFEVTPMRPESAADDRARLAAIARTYANPFIVVDGYAFDAEYLAAARRLGAPTLVVDDMASLPAYDADLVLNQNIGAERLAYRLGAGTRALLGTTYAMLRPEFAPLRDRRRDEGDRAVRALVTLGGSDPEGATVRVVTALLDAPSGFECRIVVGPANPHRAALEALVVRAPERFTLVAPTDDIAHEMAWADLAVCAGGSTCWELACLGVPFVVVALADNQRGNAAALSAAGIASDASIDDLRGLAAAFDALRRDRARRDEMSRRGMQLVDGRGAARVAEALEGLR